MDENTKTNLHGAMLRLSRSNINIIGIKPVDTDLCWYEVEYEFQWRLPNGATKWQKMVRPCKLNGTTFEGSVADEYINIYSDTLELRKELED